MVGATEARGASAATLEVTTSFPVRRFGAIHLKARF